VTDETYSLSDFLGAISGVISETFEGNFWITAELAAVHHKSKGYVVLELQEVSETGTKLASTQALVWANSIPRVVYKFEKATGQKLSPGLKVRIRVQPGFSPQWGFRLTADDIDTSWSLGEAETNNKKIRATLEAEGVFFLNQNLPAPKDFERVGIVAPDTSAGLEDFLKEAEKLSAVGVTEFVTLFAPFEGQNAVVHIPAALRKLAAEKNLDAICVVRGGGAASGIAWLNHIDIVRAVCLCPVPVFSGIGHERDNTLVDDAAHTKCGTPSKTIALITDTVVQNAMLAKSHWEQASFLAQRNIAKAKSDVERVFSGVHQGAGSLIKEARMASQSLLREILALGPSSTLERGYTVVSSEQGKVLRTKKDAENQSSVIIRFVDGAVRARIEHSGNHQKNPETTKESANNHADKGDVSGEK